MAVAKLVKMTAVGVLVKVVKMMVVVVVVNEDKIILVKMGKRGKRIEKESAIIVHTLCSSILHLRPVTTYKTNICSRKMCYRFCRQTYRRTDRHGTSSEAYEL